MLRARAFVAPIRDYLKQTRQRPTEHRVAEEEARAIGTEHRQQWDEGKVTDNDTTAPARFDERCHVLFPCFDFQREERKRNRVGKLLFWIAFSGICCCCNTLALLFIFTTTTDFLPCSPVVWHVEALLFMLARYGTAFSQIMSVKRSVVSTYATLTGCIRKGLFGSRFNRSPATVEHHRSSPSRLDDLEGDQKYKGRKGRHREKTDRDRSSSMTFSDSISFAEIPSLLLSDEGLSSISEVAEVPPQSKTPPPQSKTPPAEARLSTIEGSPAGIVVREPTEEKSDSISVGGGGGWASLTGDFESAQGQDCIEHDDVEAYNAGLFPSSNEVIDPSRLELQFTHAAHTARGRGETAVSAAWASLAQAAREERIRREMYDRVYAGGRA
mmetsp:Transcript_31084/g.53529  ORF Transcript_31084/g.53529 Transcript_31084/m.53529 type:complete len:384 (-) Transcript_31084:243-1394(-)